MLIIHHPIQLMANSQGRETQHVVLTCWSHVWSKPGALVICNDLWSSIISKVAQFRIETVLGHTEHWVGFKNPTQCWERKIFMMLIGMKHTGSFNSPTLAHLIIWSRDTHQGTNFLCDTDLKKKKIKAWRQHFKSLNLNHWFLELPFKSASSQCQDVQI